MIQRPMWSPACGPTRMFSSPESRSAASGVTLLELITVILVIAILAVMMLPIYSQLSRRADKAGCIANLRSLHVAANLSLQEHHSWPQIKTDGVEPSIVAANWISALKPYGLNQINWLCPTVQKSLQSPDMSDPANTRIDYGATPFDTNPATPFRWSRQPWFAENADVHGNGQLILFPDGHVQELGEFMSLFKKSGSSAGK